MIAFVAALLASASVNAEVFTAFETPVESTAPLQKDAAIWIKGFYSNVLKEKVGQGLKERGYKVVSDASDAEVRVVLAAGVSVPQEGKAPKLYADEVYGQGFAAIPPAVKTSHTPIDSSSLRQNSYQIKSIRHR
jgi:hypothetical protein